MTLGWQLYYYVSENLQKEKTPPPPHTHFRTSFDAPCPFEINKTKPASDINVKRTEGRRRKLLASLNGERTVLLASCTIKPITAFSFILDAQ